MIPIAFRHAPTALKPKPNASPKAVQQQRQAARLARPPLVAAEQIAALRNAIGRIRKDAKLYFRPISLLPLPAVAARTAMARPRRLPNTRQMRVKALGPVLWRTAGLAHVLRIVVIAPLKYQLRQNSRACQLPARRKRGAGNLVACHPSGSSDGPIHRYRFAQRIPLPPAELAVSPPRLSTARRGGNVG